MKITAQMIATLKKATGGVSLDSCKKALHAVNGKFEEAIEYLKKAGEAAATQRADRIAAEGIVAAFVNPAPHGATDQSSTAAILEINCETDFVSNTEDFKNFVTDTVQLAAQEQINDVDSLSKSLLKETQTVEQARQELVGKVKENIKLAHVQCTKTNNYIGHYIHNKRYGCLLELQGGNAAIARDLSIHIAISSSQEFSDVLNQPFYKNPSKTVKQYLEEHQAKIVWFYCIMLGQSVAHYVSKDFNA